MFYLVRKSVEASQGEYQDFDFDTKVLTIGNATQNNVNLSDVDDGRLVIKAKSAGLAKFECTESLRIIDAKKSLKKGKLIKGVKYKFSYYELEIIDPPGGFDFALNITKSAQAQADAQAFKTKKQSRFKFRTFSYLSFLIILALFLLIPLLSKNNPDFNNKIKDLPIPTDHSWLSGPLSLAHRIPEIGDNCQVCHGELFEKVQDDKCTSCHKNLGEHILITHKSSDKIHQYLCQNCHKEHNEPARITRNDDALCIDCHQDIGEYENDNNVHVQNVSGFNNETHPEFRLSLLKPVGKGGALDWTIKRSQYNDTLKEESNLKFSHMVHLDVDKVQSQSTGEVLSCPACHQLSEDGKHFAAITMDKDCRSCHQLTFDSFNPDLELPHGNLRSATVALQAHYIREFTDPNLRKKRARKRPRRVPGKDTSKATCVGTGLVCGQQQALKEASFQFTKSGCITCHEVVDNGGNNIIDKWYVKPIKITDDWYTKSQFDHKSHLSVSNSNQKEICLSCHQVEKSDASQDIAIPQKENCMQCHQQDAKHSVELNCISCHVFHFNQNHLGEK